MIYRVCDQRQLIKHSFYFILKNKFDQLGDMPIFGAIVWRGVAQSRLGAEVPNLPQKFPLLVKLGQILSDLHETNFMFLSMQIRFFTMCLRARLF